MNQPLISVIHSVFDGTALITHVLCKYAISQPLRCKLYKRGLNDTYLVEAETENYILRIYCLGWRNKQEIDFELELLEFLHQQNQPVAYPIARQDGGFTTEIFAPEGTRYAAVFTYAPGHAVEEKLDHQQSYLLGKTLANIHQISNEFQSSFLRPELNTQYLLDWSIDGIANLYKHRKSELAYLQQQIDKIKFQLSKIQLSHSSPDYGICVGDVHSGNAHFNDQNQPTLFDFDQCGYGWRAFDIAKFLHASIRRKIDITIRNKFLEGYQTIRQISQKELTLIPIFMKAAHIWVMGISAHAGEDILPYSWFTDDWLDERLLMLRSLDF